MKKILTTLLLCTLLLSSLVSASMIYGNKLHLRTYDRDGGIFYVDGNQEEYYKARISLTVGATLPSGQVQQAGGYMKIYLPDRERIDLKFSRREQPTLWKFNDTKIVVEQTAKIKHNYREEYERNGKIRKRTVRDREEKTIRYVVLPEERKINVFFELDGKDYKIVFEDLDYTKCIKNSSGRTQCVRY